jgi:hypothetical protein
MNRTRYMLAAFLLVCLGAFPAVSMALPQFARSIIYFDANDNLIGNSILYCDNGREHAGITDPGNANRVEFQFGCGDPIVVCSGEGLCETVGHNTADVIHYFHSATGKTRANFCLDPTYTGGPFFGRVDCDLPAPSEVGQVGVYTSGFGSN